MNTTAVTILIVFIALLFICFISPILTFFGLILKPIIWLTTWIFKLFKKAIKELSAAKKEQQKKID